MYVVQTEFLVVLWLLQSLPPLVKDSRPHSLPAATAAAGTLPPQPLIQLGDSTDNLPGVTTTVITRYPLRATAARGQRAFIFALQHRVCS